MKALNRRKYMNKWMIVKKAMIVAAVLGLIKFGLHIANLEFIEINSIISIKALHKDLELLEFMSKNETSSALLHLNSLISVIIRQFETNQWKQSEITQVIEKIDLDIAEMAAKNMAPAYVIKMRNELSNIEKISNRIDTIEETNFLPAAYVLSQTAVFFVVLILLFAIVDPYMIGMFIIFTVTFLIVGILMLIKDMDNPFETGGKGSADVDLSHVYKLDKYLKNHEEVK
jgi:hypothetical protein